MGTKLHRFRLRQMAGGGGGGPTGYVMPSVTDEKNTYTLWGWSWNSPQEPSNITEQFPGGVYPAVTQADIHSDTEADDLWTYATMVQRGASGIYPARRASWKTFFRSGIYRTGTGYSDPNGRFEYDRVVFGADHLYGWGLLREFELDNSDTTSLTEAEAIAALVEALWNPAITEFACLPSNGCTHYGVREIARHLLFITRLYEITLAFRGSGGTNVARWLTLLNTIKSMALNSTLTTWDKQYGVHFYGQTNTDDIYGSGKYAAGMRVVSIFQVGILAEALFNYWRVSGDDACRVRLLRMADFVMIYGLDSEYNYSGGTLGVYQGLPLHVYSAVEIINHTVAIRSDGADTRQVTLYGQDTADMNISEVLTLNGTSDVVSTKTYRRLHRMTVASSSGSRVITFRLGAAGAQITNNLGSNVSIGTGATSTNLCPNWDPNYTTSIVNLLVMAYKFTGTQAYLDRAKVLFNRGTKGVYGSSSSRQAADGAVGHFVDTEFESSQNYFYLSHNKSELFYSYLIFENGGAPSLIAPTSNTLKTFVATLSPGQLAEMTVPTLTSGYLSYGSLNIMLYTDSGAWNTLNKRILAVCQIGADGNPGTKLIQYDAATNAFTDGPAGSWFPIVHSTHGYDMNVCDPETGDLYHQSLLNIWCLRAATQTWDSSPVTTFPHTQTITGLAWAWGGIIAISGYGSGSVDFWNKTTNAWTNISSYPSIVMGAYHNIAEYNPVHNCVIGGGGNGSPSLFKILPDFTVKTLPNAPFNLGIIQSIFGCDPVTGKFIVWVSDLSNIYHLYLYDHIANTWTLQSDSNLLTANGTGTGDNSGFLNVCIPEYGCNVFLEFHEGGTPHFYVRKGGG